MIWTFSHRVLTIIPLVVSTLIGHAQSLPVRSASDTLFKKYKSGSHTVDKCNIVYIERDTKASCYKRLENTSDIETMYKSYLSEEKRSGKPKRSITDLPQNWCHVKSYKGTLYLYAPCDWYMHPVISIRNNVIIDGPGSDLALVKDISVTKASPTYYKIRRKMESGTQDNRFSFDIHIVDTTRNIAIFEYSGEHGKKEYELMIDMRHLSSLPAIVNECPCQKVMEFKLDDPPRIDFIQSIKQNRIVIK